MRKSIFILAAIFAATFANAQINLVHTLAGEVIPIGYDVPLEETSYLLSIDKENNTISIFDSNFSLYKTVNITPPDGYTFNGCSLAYNNIFAINKIGFVVEFIISSTINSSTMNAYRKKMIIDEDGNILYDLGSAVYASLENFFYMNGSWYMSYKTYSWNEGDGMVIDKTDFFSLPGNGESADVSEVSAPRHNVRKYLHNDQVLIDSNDRTYNVQGAQVR